MWIRIVEQCFRRELGDSISLPDDTVDLIEAGILDSMSWVSFLRGVEIASGVSDLGSALNEQPATFASVFAALQQVDSKPLEQDDPPPEFVRPGRGNLALITGSSLALASRVVPSEEIDRAFGMPIGKLRHRAGIESLAYAAEGENELTLGAKAAEETLRGTSCGAHELDWIIATSETHHNYPLLAAQLHSRLLVRENCGALDVGGACLGLLNALAVARSLIGSGAAQNILVVTADVHSRTLTPGRVKGEFGGLFGDGATAFLLRGGNGTESDGGYRVGEFLFGCAGQYAAAIQVSDDLEGGLAVRFDGDALSRAAITRLEKTISAVESRSGIPRAAVGYFATHQPNPRLLTLLAKQCGVSPQAFPPICRTSGNLGSSMCAAALHTALQSASQLPVAERKPIFLASLGPGLLFGGTWLSIGDQRTEAGD
ncbi:MAG TPA: 3-oxoacyl-[acyl-carrier-protein] synthase III C-terminal domain-containing protein [Methylomirabilota bacterium]|nr:3-oxoacyl-[acyl-carrier-protein] synthase III C-terminal domain-containing protein [Methylomirabilota bacterium]